MPRKRRAKIKVTAIQVRQFFSWSDWLDHDVLRPLSHIRPNWEVTWNKQDNCYEPEDSSFAQDLNDLISDLASTNPLSNYHQNEDVLANYVVNTLRWKIVKINGRWEGADYLSILEQGGFKDVAQSELMAAAAGRVHAAIQFGQMHFDEMDPAHQTMLSGVLTVILYHRTMFD